MISQGAEILDESPLILPFEIPSPLLGRTGLAT